MSHGKPYRGRQPETPGREHDTEERSGVVTALVARLRQPWTLVGVVIAALYLFLGLQTVYYGPFNPDEGFYLYNAWRLGSGDIPYRDFAFHQPPLVLVPHAFFQKIFGPGFYLGRLVNLGIGGGVVLLAFKIAQRLGGTAAGVIAAVSLVSLPWFIQQMVSVSTYALTALMILATLWAYLQKKGFFTGVLLVATIWTRLSLLPAMSLIMLAAALGGWKYRREEGFRVLQGVLAAIALFIVPFAIWIPEYTWANIIHHNIYSRQDAFETDGESVRALIARTSESWQQEYWPIYQWPWLFAFAGLAGALGHRRSGLARHAVLLITMAAITALLHAPAINVTYDVPVLPLLSIVGSTGCCAIILNRQRPAARPAIAAAVTLLVLLVSFFPQQGRLDGRNQTEIYSPDVRRVVHYIKTHTAPDDILFTPELYFAVEAQRAVTSGLGLGRFFFFPDFSPAQAAVSNVLTSDQFWQTISSRQAKLLIFHEQHWWRRIRDEGSLDAVMKRIEASGYAPVDTLRHPPAIEEIRIYARQ